MIRSNRLLNMRCSSNGIVINSNFRYDWADLVDFGYIDKCRFHIRGITPTHLRFFRLNSAESKSFVVLKKKFIYAWKEDLQDNFANASKSSK